MSGYELEIPFCEKGIGKLISSAQSADLIDGVTITPFPLWPDDRGYFLEVARMGKGRRRAFLWNRLRFRRR